MLFILNQQHSIANHFLAEMRDVDTQLDRLRFRRNLERLGEILAYEISKSLHYTVNSVDTPLGTAEVMLCEQHLVLGTVLRAGLPFHQGMLNYFDKADNAFVAAFRRHRKDGTLEIQLDYVGAPSLDGAVLILADPMLATGASIVQTLQQLERFGKPAALHIAAVIASTAGVETIRQQFPHAHVWIGAVDEELTAKSYIVPGLGDAGDLAFGEKL